MASNTFSNRRGQLSRPGVCTPPPPPPPSTALYLYSLLEWYDDPASPTLELWLTASNTDAPATPPGDWSHDTNADTVDMNFHSWPPDRWHVLLALVEIPPVIYIHSTLLDGPSAPTTASFFFPVPSS